MRDACTILSPIVDPDSVLLACLGAFGRGRVEVRGCPPRWDRVIVRGSGGSVLISHMEPDEPDGQFQEMIRVLELYFGSVRTPSVETRDRVVRWFGQVRYAVGILAFPGFSEQDGHWPCILAAAERLRGMVLYRTSLYNCRRDLILDVDGRCQEAALGGVLV